MVADMEHHPVIIEPFLPNLPGSTRIYTRDAWGAFTVHRTTGREQLSTLTTVGVVYEHGGATNLEETAAEDGWG